MPKKTLRTVLATLVFAISQCSSSPMPRAEKGREADTYNNFAECVTEKGAVLYGVKGCYACTMQKDAFGDAFQHINYVDCGNENDKCSKAGIWAYPTWIFANDVRHVGYFSLEDLAVKTGCELKKD